MQRHQRSLYSRLDSWLTDPTWLRAILFTVMVIIGAGVCFGRALWWWILWRVVAYIFGFSGTLPFAVAAILSLTYDVLSTDIVKMKARRGWRVPDYVLHRLTWGMWGLSVGVIVLLILAGV